MDILLTTDTLGGVWTFTRELAAALCRRGHHVTLVSFGGPSPLADCSWMQRSHLTYLPSPLGLEWMPGAMNEVERARLWLHDRIAALRPDIVHCSQFAFASLPLNAPIVLTAHSDVCSWWRAVHGVAPPPSPWSVWYRRLVAAAFANADAVTAPTRAAASDFVVSHGRRQPVRVIPNAASPGPFPVMSKQPLAAGVGRVWDAGKQIHLLDRHDLALDVQVAGSLTHPTSAGGAAPKTDATVAGGPPPAGVGCRLTLLGPQSPEQVRQLLAQASIFIGPSRYEPFGLAALEAACAECALLLNDIPSYREVWGSAAAYFRRDDGADMSRQLARLAADRPGRERLARAAARRARARYSPDALAARYEHLYLGLLRPKRARIVI